MILLGIGDWGLGIGKNHKSQITNTNFRKIKTKKNN